MTSFTPLPSHKAIYWFLTKLHSIVDGAISGFYPWKAAGWGAEIFLIPALEQPFYYHLWLMQLVLWHNSVPSGLRGMVSWAHHDHCCRLEALLLKAVVKTKVTISCTLSKASGQKNDYFLKRQTHWRERSITSASKLVSIPVPLWGIFGVQVPLVCPGCTAPLCFAKAPGRWLSRSYSTAFDFCFHEKAGRAALCSWLSGHNLDPNHCCSMLPERGGNKPVNSTHLQCTLLLQVATLQKRKSTCWALFDSLVSWDVWNEAQMTQKVKNPIVYFKV